MQKLQPALFTKVRFDDAFWAPRLKVNRRVTLPAEYRHLKETGQWHAWNWKKGEPNRPHFFWDSDVAKWIEAAAYCLAAKPNPAFEADICSIVDDMAKAQMQDGYLNSYFIRVEPRKRWTNLFSNHELYCAGHLMEAAVAFYRATGKRKFLDIVCRFADHIAVVFGRGKGQKRGYCGHPEIELALIKLYRETGVRRYLKLARFFIDERGQKPNYFDVEAGQRGEKPSGTDDGRYAYCQAHEPLRAQKQAVGHAVRAMYVYSGMADVAAETGDAALLKALKRLWNNVTTKRMHITGGLGPTCKNEGFTFDYDLPNESAYNETCANIALVFWAHRMLHLEPDGRYADVMEQALYNSVISGVALDGKRFFYANPLAAHPGVDPMGAIRGENYHYRRDDWFNCSCCPPNIARLLASLGSYAYSHSQAEVRVNLYAAGSCAMEIAGVALSLTQQTRYPWDGRMVLSVNPAKPIAFALALRVPGWCRGARLKINGRAISAKIHKGYMLCKRRWKAGDKAELFMPMPVERIEAHPTARQNAGRIALRRGPIVYCLEGADNGAELHDLRLPKAAMLKAVFEPSLLGGVTTIRGIALRRRRDTWKRSLYNEQPSALWRVPFKAIPYAVWGNRKPGEMLVWILDADAAAKRA